MFIFYTFRLLYLRFYSFILVLTKSYQRYLPHLEKLENRFTKIMVVFGRTAFFYYILHLYLIHILAAISFYVHGHTLAKISEGESVFKWKFVVPGEGFGLLGVYSIWLFVILCLYPLCKWYDKYKTNNKEKWWLSYL